MRPPFDARTAPRVKFRAAIGSATARRGPGLGLVARSSFVDAAVLTLAVWAGSTLWWIVLTSIVSWLRGRVSTRALVWVNRISGAALIAFGVVAIWVALR